MEKLKKAGRIAYCIGLAGMVCPQFFYGKFGNNFFPAWPGLPWVSFWASVFTIVILAACAAIVFEKMARTASLILGGILLAIYLFGYLPFELFLAPYNNYLGTWSDGLKESALAGGAFVMAGSFPARTTVQKSTLIKLLEKLAPFGPALFCLTMILYGLCHFLYTKPISALVPDWLPGHIFWTRFAGAALTGCGNAIFLSAFFRKLRVFGLVLGIMIFLWLFMIHIPRAIADPFSNNANEPVSAFSALAFIGTAFVFASSEPGFIGLKNDRNIKKSGNPINHCPDN